jgi:hypothetical protein
MNRSQKSLMNMGLFDPSCLSTDLEIELAIATFENTITEHNFEVHLNDLLSKQNLFEFVTSGEHEIQQTGA